MQRFLEVSLGGRRISRQAVSDGKVMLVSIDVTRNASPIQKADDSSLTLDRRRHFFFSSRRRHTRLQGDWSSDVCSSDLTRSCGASPCHASHPRSPPIRRCARPCSSASRTSPANRAARSSMGATSERSRSEEHTSELQSPCNLVCRLLLEKKK